MKNILPLLKKNVITHPKKKVVQMIFLRRKEIVRYPIRKVGVSQVMREAYLKFECEHSFCNAHLIRELIGTHKTTRQIWTEMMLGVLITGFDARKESISEPVSLDILKMYDKSILMGYQENPDIDIGKGKSSSKVINLLRRMDRHKEDILKFLLTTDVMFDNILAKESTENV